MQQVSTPFITEIQIFYKCPLLNTPAPYHHTPTFVLHCQDNAFTVMVLARFTPNMLDPIWAELINQASFHVRKQRFILQFCAEEVFVSDGVHHV